MGQGRKPRTPKGPIVQLRRGKRAVQQLNSTNNQILQIFQNGYSLMS